MNILNNTRVQSVVVGFAIVFAVIIITLGIYVNTQVPVDRAEAEFEHSQQFEQESSESELVEAITTISDDRTLISYNSQIGKVSAFDLAVDSFISVYDCRADYRY